LNKKNDFPILSSYKSVSAAATGSSSRVKKLHYLDSAATSQKPATVIEAEKNFYLQMNANIHRGIHTLAEKATEAYERTRIDVAEFIGASDASEIIFTKGTTESINLVAYTWGEQNINEGDEIVVSIFEHHSNLVPWQQLCKRKNAVLKILHPSIDGEFLTEELIFSSRTKLVAITQMSNATGTLFELESVIKKAREAGAAVLVDAAQSVAHTALDVQKIGADFVAFSAHKMLGPTGVGVLWGKMELLEEMPPFLFGGDMIKEVTLSGATWNDIPYKFEAGTPNIAGVCAFSEAINYLRETGMDSIHDHVQELLAYAFKKLEGLPGLTLHSSKENNGGIISFTIAGIHPHDIGSVMDSEGVAVRTGFLCAEPLVRQLGVNSLVRMSFYLYNDIDDVDAAVEAIKRTISIFKN